VRIRSWRGTTPVSTSARRRFPWARVLLIGGAVAIALYLFVPTLFFVSADALVQGDLVPVTPIFRARIDRLLVKCDDRVDRGQLVAVVSNFIVQADYEQQLQQSVASQSLSQIALDQGVSAARTAADAAEEKYVSTKADADRLGEVFVGYDRAYRDGGIARFDWESKRADWQAAIALAAEERGVWQHAQQHVGRVESDNRAKLASDRTAANRTEALVKRVGAEKLNAPVGGYVVDCKERPDNVVDAGASIVDIFSPQRAYVLAYFNPDAISHARIGGRVDVDVAGLPQPIEGRIESVYPNLVKLPPQLERFFWQHVQWSEYRPVRISLDRVPPTDRAALYYDAQARVNVRIRDAWRPFGLFGFARP
jgi:multidrug resistance efflux pump